MDFTTVKLSPKAACFFQKHGADIGIQPGEVLHRLLAPVSAGNVFDAAALTMWYFDAMTEKLNEREKTQALYVFVTLCYSMFNGNKEIFSKYNIKLENKANKAKSPVIFIDEPLKMFLTKEAGMILKQHMHDAKMTESEVIDRAVEDILSHEEIKIPYILMNYMFNAARQLIMPQARMTVAVCMLMDIDRIREYNNISTDAIKKQIQDGFEQLSENRDVAENFALIKKSGFYQNNFADKS